MEQTGLSCVRRWVAWPNVWISSETGNWQRTVAFITHLVEAHIPWPQSGVLPPLPLVKESSQESERKVPVRGPPDLSVHFNANVDGSVSKDPYPWYRKRSENFHRHWVYFNSYGRNKHLICSYFDPLFYLQNFLLETCFLNDTSTPLLI